MKVYLVYKLPKNNLYAYTDSKDYIKRFLSERNPNVFKVITTKIDDDEYIEFLRNKELLKLIAIPLEDSNGDCDIIGTIEEDNTILNVCEKFGDICEYLKVHFTENDIFNDEYTEILGYLTTISKNINNHPIIQIDSVKLFYHLFKDTFIEIDEDDENDIDDMVEEFKNQ